MKRGPRVAIGLVVLLVLAAVAYGVFALVNPTCGPAVADVDGQCIGVTDGSVDLSHGTDAALGDVLATIARQNVAVLQDAQKDGRPWVTLAYLIPLPRPDGDAVAKLPQPALVDELRGAAAAQAFANRLNAGGQPRVRLLVANDGEGAGHENDVVPALRAMADPSAQGGDDRLVAVVATGKSVDTTGTAIAGLTGSGIPVITSRLSADDLVDPKAVPPTRTAPTNTDQAAALVAAFPELRTAMIVRSRDAADKYSGSLGNGFQDAWLRAGRTLLPPVESYTPGAGQRDMDKVMRNICAQKPDVVLFAGRTPQLLTFVEAYSPDTCQGHPLTVLTGSDAIDFANGLRSAENGPVRDRLTDRVSVYYSAIADPTAWSKRPDAFDRAAQQPLRGVTPLNAATIMGSDTVTLASRAIGDAYAPGQPSPNADQVRLALQRFNGVNAEPLASGWLAVDSETGLAVNKATPILHVLPGGGDEFYRLSATGGKPCVPTAGNCFTSNR